MHQRTETEIMQNWQGDRTTPLVSICTITYNHESYITKALDSFLMQKTSFPFEIVISDDCSTDENAKIIQTYIDKYPTIFNANLRNVNVGMRANGRENLKSARGEYIALCEGDDYWTDSLKLQKQIDILKKYKDINICFHKAKKIDMRNQAVFEIGQYLDHDGIIPIEDIILKSQGQIPTASLLFRKHVAENYIQFQQNRPWLEVGDIYICFFGAKHGGAYFINSPMSAYRHYAVGSWSNIYKDDSKKKIRTSNARIRSYEELDILEKNRFTRSFKQANKKRVLSIIKDSHISYLDKILFTLKHKRYFSRNEKIAYFGLVLIPIASHLPKKFLKKLLQFPVK